jgi:glycogen operon protein
MLMLSQGTPLLFMGDEFGNTQFGNNNPYCHDDEITWLNWTDKSTNKELFAFVKSLIDFRRKNKVFRQDAKCKMTDYMSVGYPDLSYHNQVAWMPKISDESRHIAMMLCGDYAKGNEGQLWYVAFNMHWEPQEFALPKLPVGHSWEKCLTTESTEGILAYGSAGTRDKTVIIAPRSIAVYCSSQ